MGAMNKAHFSISYAEQLVRERVARGAQHVRGEQRNALAPAQTRLGVVSGPPRVRGGEEEERGED